MASYASDPQKPLPQQGLLPQVTATFAEIAHLITLAAPVDTLQSAVKAVRRALLDAMAAYAERFSARRPLCLLPASALAPLVAWAAAQPDFCSSVRASVPGVSDDALMSTLGPLPSSSALLTVVPPPCPLCPQTSEAKMSSCRCTRCLYVLTCQVEAYVEQSEATGVALSLDNDCSHVVQALFAHLSASPCALDNSLYARIGLVFVRLAQSISKTAASFAARVQLAVEVAAVYRRVLEQTSAESCGLLALINMGMLILLAVR